MVKIGIIGSGFGLYGLLPAFNSLKNGKAVSICGKKSERMVRYCRSIGLKNIYTDWRLMLKNERLDAIALAVPPNIQFEIAKVAIGMDINIFAEKPLAGNVWQAKKLLELAVKKKITHTVDFIFPEIDVWQTAKQLIDNKVLGELKRISVNWDFLSFDIKHKRSSWKTNISEGGGALSFYFSHVLYYLEYYAGKISELESKFSYSEESINKGEVGIDLLMEFKNGVTGNAHLSSISRDLNRHQVVFECKRGKIILENKDSIVDNFTLTIYKENGKKEVFKSDDHVVDNEDERVKIVRKLASRFVEACIRNEQVIPSFREGLRVQELIEKIRQNN